MSAYLLDTHTWLWHVGGEPRIRQHVRSALDGAQIRGKLFVSAFSVWDLAQKEAAGKLALVGGLDELLEQSFAAGGLILAPVTVGILVGANRLPGNVHGDPADRIIITTAREHGYTLVTHDVSILRYAKQGHLAALAV